MIGIFDSGVGGLAIWREVVRKLPETDILYLADNGGFPYGPRPPESIRQRTEAVSRLLIERGSSLIVAACNTATVTAIRHLRETFAVPFVGVVPPVKVAASSGNGPIFALMTENTSTGRKYLDLLEQFANGRRVEAICLPLLARVVEDGSFRDPATAALVVRTLREITGIAPAGSKVVLGCTHYVFLEELIREALGPEAEILDPSAAVAAQVARVLEERGLPRAGTGRREFLATGDPRALSAAVSNLLGLDPPPPVERVSLGLS
jgi:glutamate racemase